MLEQYLFRLNNFEDCRVIDVFNIEFCESPPLDSNQIEKMDVPSFTFQIAKDGRKKTL